MSLREAFAANLMRLCRGEQSIASVCRATKINRQQFNRYLSGASLPSQRNLEKICAYFGVGEPELFGKPGERMGKDADSNDDVWSHADLRAILKRLFKGAPTSIEPGLYFAHFAYPPEPNTVMRSTVIVRREGGLSTFRRLTGFAEPKGSWWSRFQGDHQGIILERRRWIYFTGLNQIACQEPTVFMLRWEEGAEPTLGGFATILTPEGPTVTAVLLTACGPNVTLRSALRSSHIYSLDDPKIDPIVIDALEHQCRRLTTMMRRLDLSVTPKEPRESLVQW